MGSTIGIDLGTTFSVVAIPEDRAEEGYLSVTACPGCSVILDGLNRRITPSVVSGDGKGNVIVGYKAKGRAGQTPGPIMFAKRFMGENKAFEFSDTTTLRPEEVSGHVLRYLKEMAEERLGHAVDEAVITVPAYFGMKATQLTEKAGELAGLRVAKLIQEPVAAALMYCKNDDRPDLRILTYDLGGGTFDVAVLQKHSGIIDQSSILGYGGDAHLGGYNFDTMLAEWLLDRLIEQGYDLPTTAGESDYTVMFAKLLVIAERIKIVLSKTESHDIQEPSPGIQDRNGNDVVIDMPITRAQFEEMIAPEIEGTVRACTNVLRSVSGYDAGRENDRALYEQIDEVFLVGGSSRIPLIAQRLEETFGKKPQLIEPDLCVALGAAILSGSLAKSYGGLALDPIPSETDEDSIDVTGNVSNAGAPVAEATVTLRALDGSYNRSRETNAHGGFAFEDVPLVLDGTQEFTVLATSNQGSELGRHQFSVLHKRDADISGDGELPKNTLAKPLQIEVVDGMFCFAEERTPLEYNTTVYAKTMDASGQIRVPIFEEHARLGEIRMTEIPTSVPIGSTVEINLTVQENFQILGRAYVPTIGKDASVVIDLPARDIKPVEVLRAEFLEMKARGQSALSSASPDRLMEEARGLRLSELLDMCERLLDMRTPDASRVQDKMDEIERIIGDLSRAWRPEPPREVFDQIFAQTKRLLDEVIAKHPEVAHEGYESRLAAIDREAGAAYEQQNGAAWTASFEHLVRVHQELQQRIQPTASSSQRSDVAADLNQAREKLEALKKEAIQRDRYEALKPEFEDAAASLKAINPNGANASNELHAWNNAKFDTLENRVKSDGGGLLGGIERGG